MTKEQKVNGIASTLLKLFLGGIGIPLAQKGLDWIKDKVSGNNLIDDDYDEHISTTADWCIEKNPGPFTRVTSDINTTSEWVIEKNPGPNICILRFLSGIFGQDEEGEDEDEPPPDNR